MNRVQTKHMTWLVAAVVLLTHATYLANGFVWLDHGDIEGKRAILPLGSLSHALTERFGATGYYRPLVTAIHSVTQAMFGEQAWGHHLVNVILHLLVSVVAARFVQCFMKLERREALMVSLIVGVHSANWFTVGTISNVQEPLVVVWTMLAVINYAQWRVLGNDVPASVPLKANLRKKSKNSPGATVRPSRHGSPRKTWRIPGLSVKKLRDTLSHYIFGWPGVWALGAFILALLSKETAIVWVPGLILLYEITSRPGDTRRKTLAAWWVVAALISAAYIITHIAVVPEVWRPGAPTLSWPEAIGTRLQAVGLLFIRLVNVMPPSASDAIRVKVMSSEGLVAVLVMTAALWYGLTRGLRSEGGKTAVILALMLAPALNLVPLPRFIAPHYTYFAVVGIAAVMVILVRTFLTWRLAKVMLACVTLWIIAMSAVTFHAGSRQRDDATLFEPEVARDPYFKEGHYYLGDYYFQRGSYARARQAYEAALTATPNVLAFVDHAAAHLNYAGVLVAQGLLDDADATLARLSGKVSMIDQRKVDYNRALIAYRKEDFTRTVEFLRLHDWAWREPILLHVAALRKLGRNAEAEAILQTLRSN